ncbi:MAG: hypothetical protein QNJ91_03100 [Gammaproteobacteria bacterium]|nr:hypothetical protein [Gammaproteobacteria bacterium]
MTLTPTLHRLALALILATAGLLYTPGLDGPFLFDDHVHITQNRWVKIDAVDWPSLHRAWNSSFSDFPSNRPLAQLSFGVTHALAGLDARAYKAVNVTLHLVNGLLIYAFVRLAQRALSGDAASTDGRLVALVAAAVWVIHPLHVSSVLYVVQRMTLLSALAMLLALLSYVWGRLQISRGRPGIAWMLAAAPMAMIGFLSKENAALVPLLLLSIELTLLNRLTLGTRARAVRAVQLVYIVLPIAAAFAYLSMHPGLLSYDQRPFTLEERLLTQPRVLWTYVSWLLVPDVTAFGLFHDDVVVSRGWTQPPTTLAAIAALIAIALAAVTVRRRFPVFAFAVLFFLANHALESSVFPLEMVFEHRNYLASIGPLLLLAYLIVIASRRLHVHRAALVVGVLLLISYGVVTTMRVDSWSSYQNFVFNAAENHPDSRRSSFMAAQLLISAIGEAEGDVAPLALAADRFLDNGLRIDARCLDCLFGKIALHLHLGRQPPRDIVERLVDGLRHGDVGPTYVSVSQFSYLARWHKSDGHELLRSDVEAIFDAALSNPQWILTGRAGVAAAYREYHEHVTGDLERAEQLARATIAAWPDQWGYHVHLLRVLQKRNRYADAARALYEAESTLKNARQREEFEQFRQAIDRELQNPPYGNDPESRRTEHHPAGTE